MSTLAAMFPTLLALYITLALSTARRLVASYDRDAVPVLDGTEVFTPAQRITAVTGFAVLWPLTWTLVLVGSAVAGLMVAWARRGA